MTFVTLHQDLRSDTKSHFHRNGDLPSPKELKMIEEELLEYYLALDDKRRARQFADTARVANLVGLSQRTIQLWIEIGLIRAVRIGRKYQVDLESVKAHLRACASGKSDGN